VTPAGEVAWEYVNLYFFEKYCSVCGIGDPPESRTPVVNNWVFRAFRYTAEEIDRAREIN
jgi:hypothetical protein